VKRELLKLLQQFLRGELRRAKRRKSNSVLWIAILTVTVFGIGQWLYEPKAPLPNKGVELTCELRNVYDGDTVAASCEEGRLTVRVFGIDAPEMGQQPWGDQSRAMLQQLLPNAAIRLKVKDTDRYGRVVAQIYDHNQDDLGLELVRQGGAVVYVQYNDAITYQTAQRQAKQKRLGVWSQAGAQQTPWEWRKLNPR
jgi:endonuclease YncB( thermonuclease family)